MARITSYNVCYTKLLRHVDRNLFSCSKDTQVKLIHPCGITSYSIHDTKLYELKASEIPTDPVYGISLEALELALEQWPIQAIQVTPTCNNPLGS